MAPLKDLTGQRFGKLLVIKRVENTKANKAQWLCKCDCGNEVITITNQLTSGAKTSCPKCSRPLYRKDLTGQKFGRLTVLGYDQEYTDLWKQTHTGTAVFWKCQCDCGNITYAKTAELNNGAKKSCGCLQKEISGQIMKEIVQPIGVETRLTQGDLAEQRFGRLTALKRSEDDYRYWICKCDCGNIKTVSRSALMNHDTQSCGCIGNSRGEAKIAEILTQYDVPFIREYKFKDLKDKSYLRYDFAIFKNERLIGLIEYDGRQHFDTSSQWYSEDNLKRDSLKTEYAKEHNIPLLRIAYTDYEKIQEIIERFLGMGN